MGGVLGEILRRSQLAQQLNSLTGGPGQNQGQSDYNTPAPQIAPFSPPSPRDDALSSYRQALQQEPPKYNPSMFRKVAGGLLGAAQGISTKNPEEAMALTQSITHGPYNQQLTDYQRRLAQKKEAFETEAAAESEAAKIEEQKSQKEAEVARAGAEEARRKGEQYKISPEGQAFELKKLQIEHPNTPKIPAPYELELKNGEKITPVYEGSEGQFKDSEGNIYGSDSIKSARKIGTNEPKSQEPKPPREGEAGAIDQWTLEHGRAPNYSERLAIHRQYADKPVDSTGRDTSNEFKLQSAKTSAARPFERNRDLATSQLDRVDRALTEVNSSKPTDLALSIPTILTALVSGQGTGVRITQAEMNSIIHARGFGESIEAFANKLSGQGNLSDKQKSDLKGLLSDVKKKVEQRQREASDVADEIYDSNDLKGINDARTKYNKKLVGNQTQDNALPGGITLDEINAEIERRKKAK